MKRSDEKGFSLIELLIVVVIIGIVAALAIPALSRAVTAAENRNIFATMKTMNSSQAMFFTQKGRFATLAELNTMAGNTLGTTAGNQMFRSRFIFEMEPAAPTPLELRSGYSIAAYREAGGITYRYVVTNGGVVRTLPGADPDGQ